MLIIKKDILRFDETKYFIEEMGYYWIYITMHIQNYINNCVSYARIKNNKREFWMLVNLFYQKILKTGM